MKIVVPGLLIAAVALSASPVHALPPGFTLDGRTVLAAGAAEKPAAAKSFSSGGLLKPILSAEAVDQPYALRIDGAAPGAEYTILINDTPLEIAPLIAPDGQWYSIPAGEFSAGENTLHVTDSAGNTVSGDDLLGFSIDFAEEEHLQSFVAPAASPPPIDSNQALYDVQHMDLAVTLDPASATLPAAVVTLTAKSLTAGLTECVLDFNDNAGALVISAVDSGPATPGLGSVWDTANERLTITLPAPVAEGAQFTVRVTYSGTPTPDRGLRRSLHNSFTVPVLYTYNQAYDARRWFPCKDLPEDKFTMEMHATVPTVIYDGHPFSVVSNGTLISTVESGGNTTYNWKEDYPIVTQYVSIAASNYQVASDTYTALDNVTTMPAAHHVYPESYAAESPEITRTIEVMEWMANLFGEYPFLDEKYVTATWAHGGGLEHQTCTSMPDNNLNTPYHRRNVHELAHMWFGVCIGNETYDHVWLSEGWASYVEVLWLDHKNGDAAADARMDTYRASSSDIYPIVSSNGDSFSLSVVYYKAAWVLHMLRRVVGDTAFFQASRDYMADPALRYKTSVTSDFQNHVESESGQDLDWFFDQWLLRASRPSYDWAWSASQSGSDWYVDLTIDQTQADSAYVMPIDFLVTFADTSTTVITVSNTQASQVFSVNVGPVQPTDLTFDPDEWLLYGSATEQVPAAPGIPVLQSVIGNGTAGTATITWTPSGTGTVVGYRVYQSADGQSGWTRILDEATLGVGATSAVVSGLTKDDSRYYRVTAMGGAESAPTDVYGTRIGAAAGLALVVDGYDRWNSQTALSGGANHDFVADHGRAIAAHTNPFDSCANEAAGASVQLADYEIVVWMCGDESTGDETFSTAEQDLVKTYLQGGGKLFVSGNEIGWDLGRSGVSSAADLDFYGNYLKASYVADDSNDYGVDGSGTRFSGHAFAFGSGDAPYLPGYPDVISPTNGGASALVYSVGIVAGVEYKGLFNGGSTAGGVVYASFAFETLSSEAERMQMMDDVLNYFGVSVPVRLSGMTVE